MQTIIETYTPTVGDVFVMSWGYDQTNTDAFAVVRCTPKTVWVKPCEMEAVGEGLSTRLRPALKDGQPITSEFRWETIGKILPDGTVRKAINGTPSFRGYSFASAYLWNGERDFYDTLATGQPGR